MKYILIGLLLLSTSLYAQESNLVRQYDNDSSIMAIGVITDSYREGLWKYYNPKTNVLQSEGYFEGGLKNGTWTTYYPDGKRSLVANYRDNKLFGESKYYDQDGALKVELIFLDDVIVGKYTKYFGKTGNPDYINPLQVKEEGNYVAGLKSGEWLEYYDVGGLAVREFYVKGKKSGPYLRYSPEGALILEAYYSNDLLDGAFKAYSFEMAVVEEGLYKSGDKVGEWKKYFPYTKSIEAEEFYDENGNRIGTWKYYYENKRIARIEKYENGIAVGTWEEYYPNKSISKRKNYELGVPVGDYIEYHSSGKVSVSGQYESGMKTGLWKSYFPEGDLYSIGEYRNDLKTGLWKYFNKIGILIGEGEYSLGMEVGQWFYYYDGGQLKSVGSFVLGFENGIWGLFYDNKKLTQEEFWDNGRLMNVGDYFSFDGSQQLDKGTLKDGNGIRNTYYVSGKKESQGTYKLGKADGTWTFFHENGRKASEGNMVDGRKEGPWRYYNPSGRLEDLINYKNDEIVTETLQSIFQN